MENKKDNKEKKKQTELDLHRAAIINENGEEVAITEEMIQEAINNLDTDAQAS